VQQVAERLEILAKDGQLDRAAEALPSLHQAVGRLLAALAKFVEESDNT
jgi:hypothetical protein